jgi:coenzyme PQQ precursor peptide PqqA
MVSKQIISKPIEKGRDFALRPISQEPIIACRLLRQPFNSRASRPPGGSQMAWQTPIVEEICVGMEVTSYESADLPPEF